jgi:hypothetical protein
MAFDEDTRGGLRPRPITRLPTDPRLSDDTHEAIGQVMSEVMKVGRVVTAMRVDLDTQARELNGLRRDLEDDRTELVKGSSRKAATHTSNRMAMLLGTLFVLYEQAAPVLHELWKGLHK